MLKAHYKLTLVPDESLVVVCVECALQIIRLIRTDEGVIDVFENVVVWMKCKGLPFQRWALYLIGQLLVWHPQCTGHISTNGPLLDIINCALHFPEDSVKSVGIFVVVHLVRSVGWTCCLLGKPLPDEVVNILDTAHSKELRTNAMGLVRLMIMDDGLLKMLFAANRDGCTFPLVLKKIVLMKDCDLQVACVQCIHQILLVGEQREQYAEILLHNDIAEFLFEALCDTDELLVESILNCCLTFAKSTSKFVTDHVVYGIDSLIRVTERSATKLRPHLLALALEVLTETIRQQQDCLHCCGILTPRDVVQLLRILSERILYPDPLAATWAMRLSTQLLRKDVFSASIPVGQIQKLMVMCQHIIVGFFPLDSMVVSSPSDDSDRCKMTLSVLEASLCVFKAASRLYADCTKDPLTWPETYGDSQESSPSAVSLTDVIKTVIKAMDEAFVPIVLLNSNCLKWEEIFAVFFSILGDLLVLDLNNINMQFATKLTRSGIMSLSFDASVTSGQRLNSNSSEDGQIDRIIIEIRNEFIVRLLAALHKVDSFGESDTGDVLELFRVGMGHICGCRRDLCSLFEHRWLSPNTIQDSEVSFAAQTTICALCYFSQIHGVEFIPLSQLFPTICRFLTMKSINVHRHRTCYIIRYLIYLIAHTNADSSYEDYKSSTFQEALSNLVDITQQENIGRKVITFNIQIFYWVFLSEKTAIAFGRQMIVEWLKRKNNGEDDVSPIPIKYPNIIQREIFTYLMLGIAFDEDPEISQIAKHSIIVLGDYFKCQPENLKHPALYDIFTSLLGSVSGGKMIQLLTLICQWLEGDCEDDGLNGLKTLRKVCNMLTKSEDTTLECLRCCTAALVRSKRNLGDNRALNILVSNKAVTGTIKRLCSLSPETNENLSAASWTLLANIIRSETQSRLRRSSSETSNAMRLRFRDLTAAIMSSHHHVALSSLQVAHVMIASNFKTTFLILSDDEGTLPTVAATRTIFITLLDVMTKSCKSEEITAIVTDAVINLLRFAKVQHPNLATYLMKQIWLPHAIRIQLQPFPKVHVLQLINKLLDFAELSETSCKEVLANLADYLGNPSTWPQITQSQCIIDVLASIECKISKHPFCEMLTSRQKESIKSAISKGGIAGTAE